tara:strand:- start:20290 stop:20988 length:699 start_codon:yes stop_codon:yes gene_type:complete
MTPLDELETLLPRLRPAVEQARFGQGLSKFENAAQSIASVAPELDALFEVALDTGFLKRESDAGLIDDIVVTAIELAEILEGARTDGDVEKALAHFDRFESRISSAKVSIKRHWERRAADEFEPLRGYGRLLQRLPGLELLGAEYETFADSAKRSVASEKMSDLRTAIASLNSRKAELEAERQRQIKHETIGDFLNALAQNSATLKDLSPEVLDWLNEQEALADFRIEPVAL